MMKRNRLLIAFAGTLAAITLSTRVQAASVTVNIETDVMNADAECSLREAIQSVNQNTAIGGCVVTGTGDIDTVELPAGNYVLSLIGVNDDNDSGDLDVLADMTLNGAGADTTSISAQGLQDNGGPERVMHINPLGNILTTTINDVTIRDGLEIDDGGGILIEGEQFNNLVQGISGAGTGGSATLNGVNVVDNESDDDAGGIAAFDLSLTLDNVRLSNNSSPEDGGGLEYFSDTGVLQIRNSTIDGNESPLGAGIAAEGEITIDSTTISNNSDACAGGGLFVDGVVTITNSTISGNRADNANCGIAVGVDDDRLGGGMAIDELSAVAIVNSTISGNFAADGGGGIVMAIGSPAAPAPVSTVKFGAIGVEGLHLFNATIADNETDGSGGGILTITLQTTGTQTGLLNAANTILANNQAGTSPDCAADFVSEGYNLVGDTAGCNGFTGPGDQTGVDPQLGPLQDNGGPTFTQALLAGSPAIDTGDPAGCDDNNGGVLNRDQRDETRPVAILDPNTPICDIGAFEFQIPEPTPTPTPTPTNQPFLLNGTGCSMMEGAVPSAAPALLALAGLGALAYRRRRAE